jgi:hypothetical protein
MKSFEEILCEEVRRRLLDEVHPDENFESLVQDFTERILVSVTAELAQNAGSRPFGWRIHRYKLLD